MWGKLQFIRKKGLADHAPTHLTFWYLRQHIDRVPISSPQVQVCPELADTTWNCDSLLQCIGECKDRHAFVAELESAMERFNDVNQHLLEYRTPDAYFTALDCTIIQCDQIFSPNKQRQLIQNWQPLMRAE